MWTKMHSPSAPEKTNANYAKSQSSLGSRARNKALFHLILMSMVVIGITLKAKVNKDEVS